MPQFSQVRGVGTVVVQSSWANGARLVWQGTSRRDYWSRPETDSAILSHAGYLWQLGQKKEAEEYMDEALRRRAS